MPLRSLGMQSGCCTVDLLGRMIDRHHEIRVKMGRLQDTRNRSKRREGWRTGGALTQAPRSEDARMSTIHKNEGGRQEKARNDPHEAGTMKGKINVNGIEFERFKNGGCSVPRYSIYSRDKTSMGKELKGAQTCKRPFVK